MAPRRFIRFRLTRASVVCIAALWTTTAAVPPADQMKAIRFGALVDGTGRVLRDAVVIVSGDTVVSVGAGTAIPTGIQVIDLRRYTGIPGLIDVHTHMTYWRQWWPTENPVGTRPRLTKDQTVLAAGENARKTLEVGVTSVRDLGSSNYMDIAMRDSINNGAMAGPRMFVAGYGLQKLRTANRPSNPAQGSVKDTADIPAGVKAQVDAGADWVKMYGSEGSFANVSGTETFTFAEMKAAVDAAHALGKKIAVHSYGGVGGRDALLAGANSVEHAIDLDDATLAEFVRRGTFYVPTIDHNRFYAEYGPLLGYTAAQIAGLDSFRLLNTATAKRAFRAGVKIAMGSDAVYEMFGQNTRELGQFVQIGMTPAQALATATTNAAELLGMPNKLGKVAPGFFADIVAVEGDPLADIDVVINKVRWVMKGGAVVVDHR